uniref:Uncharacterized protein n=1 Tax=Tanacetum cinerariifolium TaxID=118510 RepID=A0A699L8I6_TANCI|nr:hypothetical protein [Tanacetum cinerariifolium]
MRVLRGIGLSKEVSEAFPVYEAETSTFSVESTVSRFEMRVLRGIGLSKEVSEAFPVYEAETSTFSVESLFSLTKHTEDTLPYSSGQCPKGNISIEKAASEDNIADILSLPLNRESLNYLSLGLEMMEHIL